MVKVLIPAPYRGVTSGRSQLEVAGSTLIECLDAEESACPGFRGLLFEADGALHRFTKLFHNGEQVRADHLDRPVVDGDEIEILSPIAGG